MFFIYSFFDNRRISCCLLNKIEDIHVHYSRNYNRKWCNGPHHTCLGTKAKLAPSDYVRDLKYILNNYSVVSVTWQWVVREAVCILHVQVLLNMICISQLINYVSKTKVLFCRFLPTVKYHKNSLKLNFLVYVLDIFVLFYFFTISFPYFDFEHLSF